MAILRGLRRLCGLALLTLSSSCMLLPKNGQTSGEGPGSTGLQGRSFTFNGFYPVPAVAVDVQILNSPGLDPQVASNWTTIASTTTGTTPTYANSDDPLYVWTVKATPINGPWTFVRWPQGGLGRVRAVAHHPQRGDDVLTTFDAVTSQCINDAYANGDDWMTIGQRCQGLLRDNAFLVSTVPSPVDFTANRDYLGRKGSIDEAETWAYYSHIGAPPTLQAFKQEYLFSNNNDVTATYYNDGDLGLGREMHCKTWAGKVACYVTNYSGFDGVPAFGVDPVNVLAHAVTRQGAFATVAMVYDPFDFFNNPVQFMVYNDDGDLTAKAQLDSTDNRVSVPNNCLACHGINADYNPNLHTVIGPAQFLPFDVFSFKYSGVLGFTYAAQADAFRRLNALVKATQPAPAIQQFIDGLYAPKAVTDPTAVVSDAYIPPAWLSEPDKQLDGIALYRGVVKPGCRTCHMSATDPKLDFLQYSDFFDPITRAQIGPDVCGGKEMPHAEHTLKKFWNSGARAYLVAALGIDLNAFPCRPSP